MTSRLVSLPSGRVRSGRAIALDPRQLPIRTGRSRAVEEFEELLNLFLSGEDLVFERCECPRYTRELLKMGECE